MSIQMILGTAIASITASKLRSSLTLLGVIIGVTSVIALLSIGRGAQDSITSRISSQGAELLFVNVNFASTDAKDLTLADVTALAQSPDAPDVDLVAATLSAGNQPISLGATALNTNAVGITPEYFAINAYSLGSGRNISPADLIDKSSVAVLGSNLATNLYPGVEATGQYFSLAGRRYLVAGVLKPVGGITRVDDQVFIPLTTAESQLVSNAAPGDTVNVSQIIVKAHNADTVDAASEQVDIVLRLQHQLDFVNSPDFTISNSAGIAETLQQTTDVLVIFLGVVGGISLFVGGIGIMNIMLVSVTERTREIGIRRAVGARRSAVLLQFLAEATVLSIGGGLLGVLIGAIVTRQFSGVQFLNNTFDAKMSVDVAVMALVVAAGIGLIAGIYPAARAASLNPIDALRHE